ncbi:MAG: SRPBCC family protein [Candidatus Dormiibacterota bacterium]
MTTTATAIGTTQVYRVYIKTTPQAIWDAITKPEWTERYGYCGRVDYDLRPGGPYTGYSSEGMRAMGAPEVAVDGEVLEADPPHKLVQTFRMVMDPAMAAQGFTRVTYEIEERRNGVSRLTLTHELEGAPLLAVLMSGGMEDQGAGGGWSWVLSGLKTLLETGQSLDASGHQ